MKVTINLILMESRNIRQGAGERPKISVVVPIYNMEKLMRKCLDSIMAQTFQDYECLLIDDGSKDGSPAICDEYAARDSRVKAFHKQNEGVSAARQYGMDNAVGEYVIHIDPDDWVEPKMLEELYKKAKEDNADMVICDFYENSYKGQIYIKQQPSSLDSKVVLKELFKHLHGSCCNKLVRKKIFRDYNVFFPPGVCACEDLYVIASLLKNEIKVSYINMAFYHYVRNSQDSLSRRFDNNSENNYIYLRNLFVELFKDSELYNLVNYKFTYTLVASAFWGGRQFYTSKQFSKQFVPYVRVISRPPFTVKKKLLLLSIKGFYHPIIDIVDFYMKLRQTF